MHLYVGMKRSNIQNLRDKLDQALRETPDDISLDVEMYGDVDASGVVLHINNEDMERDEVPSDAIYAELETD